MLFRILFVFLILCGSAAATTYRWVDAAGTLNFTDNYGDIPARYRQQAQVVEGEPVNVVPGSSAPERSGSTQQPAVRTDEEAERLTADDRQRKHDAPDKRKKHRHTLKAPQVTQSPARRAEQRIEEQLRRDRQKLDDALLPGRRAMEQNEETIRKTREGISGH